MYTSTSIGTEINYCFLEADSRTGNSGDFINNNIESAQVNSDGKPKRLFDIDKKDAEAFYGIILHSGVVAAAAGADLPAIAVTAKTVANIVSTALFYDTTMDFLEIENPQPSDKAKMWINAVNYGLGLYNPSLTIPSAIFGVMDLHGCFDSIYEQFNK